MCGTHCALCVGLTPTLSRYLLTPLPLVEGGTGRGQPTVRCDFPTTQAATCTAGTARFLPPQGACQGPRPHPPEGFLGESMVTRSPVRAAGPQRQGPTSPQSQRAPWAETTSSPAEAFPLNPPEAALMRPDLAVPSLSLLSCVTSALSQGSGLGPSGLVSNAPLPACL